MAYTVEVQTKKEHLLDAMSGMRTWLDARRCEPGAFRCNARASSITIRVELSVVEDAEAFAKAFEGRLRQAASAGIG